MKTAAANCDSFIKKNFASKLNMASNCMADELRQHMTSDCRTTKNLKKIKLKI